MVTLASSAKANLALAVSPKTAMRFERQQPARCSKKLKRNQHDSLISQLISCSTPKNKFSSHELATLNSHRLPGSEDSAQLPVQLLACHEDSSFIYSQQQHENSMRPTPSSGGGDGDSLAPTRRPHSTTDSMISSSSSISMSFSSSGSSSGGGGATTSKRLRHNQTLNCSDYYSSASPSCISALDYCHLYSSSPSCASNKLEQQVASAQANQQQQQQQQPVSAADPVYLDDEQVFHNLVAKERAELARRQCDGAEWPLVGQTRHSLLSWMLEVCERQMCQDEIFSLATMIVDKFLLSQQRAPISERDEQLDEELKQRQLYLVAACSLLLATKLRQTPRLSIQSLVESSRRALPVELSRDEIFDGELLVLAALKWDLAALVTPNDFLALLLAKCQPLAKFAHQDEIENNTGNKWQQQQQQQLADTANGKRCEESRVRRHTQDLLELCLMGKFCQLFSLFSLAHFLSGHLFFLPHFRA